MLTAFSGRVPSQNEFELNSLIKYFKARGVKRYLEIGSREGDTFVEIMKALPARSVGVAMDLPGGMWGKVTTKSKLAIAIAHLVKRGYKVCSILGDSHTSQIRKQAEAKGPYDAILIDGDHTLLGVAKDFEDYKHLAPVIAFHDIVGEGCVCNKSGAKVEVPIFWRQVKESHADLYDFQEFIGEGSRMGIGVMTRKDAA